MAISVHMDTGPGVRHGRHAWVAGSWVRERHGYHYVEPQWEDNHDGRWRMHPGHWDHD